MNLTPSEQLAHSTVRIECELPNGGRSTGTGFFYALNRDEDQYIPVIITNKHVIEGSSKGRFMLTLKDGSGQPIVGANHGFELDQFQTHWHHHPDPSVDLCVMPIAPLLKIAEQQGKYFFYTTFDKSLIPTSVDIAEMIGLEEIKMVGYPNGLWDKANNLPIFRRGMLASNYKRDWNGKKEFIIDAACFPGSSGSPVLLFDLGNYQSIKGNLFGQSRIKLIGILYAGFQHTVEGEVKIVTIPTHQKAITISGVPNNLGIIIKSEQLLAFEGMFK